MTEVPDCESNKLKKDDLNFERKVWKFLRQLKLFYSPSINLNDFLWLSALQEFDFLGVAAVQQYYIP